MEYAFVCGRISLDLLGTLRKRDSRRQEMLMSAADVSDWALQGGIVDVPFDVDGAGYDGFVRLREAIFRLTRRHVRGEPWDEADLRLVESAAMGPPVTLRLTADRTLHREGDLRAVESTVARDAIELLGGPDADLITPCAASPCTRLFVDRTRGRTRRWCGMAGCGNRAKAASYRRRRRAAGRRPDGERGDPDAPEDPDGTRPPG